MSSSDILAALRPSVVRVVCHDIEWTLYPRNAIQWLGVIGYDLDGLSGVLPGSVDVDQCEAMFQLAVRSGDIDRRWTNAARVAVARASGRDWWWTVNLCRKALTGWPYINGRLLLEGVHAFELSFPDFLDAVYMLLWSGSDEKERMKLDQELQLPPAGVAVRQSRQQKIKMMEAFAAD